MVGSMFFCSFWAVVLAMTWLYVMSRYVPPLAQSYLHGKVMCNAPLRRQIPRSAANVLLYFEPQQPRSTTYLTFAPCITLDNTELWRMTIFLCQAPPHLHTTTRLGG